jgi:hypothetical protein
MGEYGFTRYLKQAEKPGWSLQIPGSLQFTAVLGIRDILVRIRIRIPQNYLFLTFFIGEGM